MTAQPIESNPTRRYRHDHPIIFLLEAKARRRWLAQQAAIRGPLVQAPTGDDEARDDEPQPVA